MTICILSLQFIIWAKSEIISAVSYSMMLYKHNS